jgi:glycosyltransferase involved in cell wall biosynthesis
MNKLSVAIITFNEEKNIERCIKSVQPVADEILVVDSFSTDSTRSICQRLGARFIEHAFEGHIQQKNYALTQCSFDYVLSLDADEALSEQLIAEIQKIKHNWTSDGYYFNRLNHYGNVPIRHCGWYPDRSLRLWNRNKGAWGGNNPHDKFFMADGASKQYIKGDLLHYTTNSIEQHVDTVNKFTKIAAQSKFERCKKANIFMLLVYPKWVFFRMYVIKLGFLDGFIGLVVCKISAHAVFLKYAKLYRLRSIDKQLTCEK